MRIIFTIHAVLALIGLGLIAIGRWRRRRQNLAAAAVLRLHRDAEEPQTLHPVIDPDVCIGSGACVRACPEERALIIVDGRARLAHASGCVGHGACLNACPVDAITLVFGSARRGVDLPELDERFQTSQAGLYIAGELGGMGLIATAVRQGVKAAEAAAASLKLEPPGDDTVLPMLVVGSGPAGIAATLAARKLGLACRTIEKEASLGGAVRSYPRGKIVMTTPADLPFYGRVHLRRASKEALIELWHDVFTRVAVEVEFGVTLERVAREGDHLVAHTSAGPIAARRILLATGRRGRPRHLGVEGEALPHVGHLLIDPAEHDGEHCVVVGGGDTAIEAALALVERSGTSVVLVHRGQRFDRARPENQERLASAEGPRLRLVRGASLGAIRAGEVDLVTEGGSERLRADAVLVLIGSELPLDLLGASGITVRTYRGEGVSRPRA